MLSTASFISRFCFPQSSSFYIAVGDFVGGERVKLPMKISELIEPRTFVYWMYGDIAWLV